MGVYADRATRQLRSGGKCRAGGVEANSGSSKRGFRFGVREESHF